MTNEFELDDGSRAMVFATGKILHWLGGDDVAEL
jgi:hypothetical protein